MTSSHEHSPPDTSREPVRFLVFSASLRTASPTSPDWRCSSARSTIRPSLLPSVPDPNELILAFDARVIRVGPGLRSLLALCSPQGTGRRHQRPDGAIRWTFSAVALAS